MNAFQVVEEAAVRSSYSGLSVASAMVVPGQVHWHYFFQPLIRKKIKGQIQSVKV